MTHANQSPAQTNKTALRAGSSNVPVMGNGKAFDEVYLPISWMAELVAEVGLAAIHKNGRWVYGWR